MFNREDQEVFVACLPVDKQVRDTVSSCLCLSFDLINLCLSYMVPEVIHLVISRLKGNLRLAPCNNNEWLYVSSDDEAFVVSCDTAFKQVTLSSPFHAWATDDVDPPTMKQVIVPCQPLQIVQIGCVGYVDINPAVLDSKFALLVSGTSTVDMWQIGTTRIFESVRVRQVGSPDVYLTLTTQKADLHIVDGVSSFQGLTVTELLNLYTNCNCIVSCAVKEGCRAVVRRGPNAGRRLTLTKL